MSKTVHTEGEVKGSKIEFPTAKISDFGRADPAYAWIKFECSLGAGMARLFDHMGWQIPGEKTKVDKFEGKLLGGNLILTSKEKLVDSEIDLTFKECTGFECHRFELEGKKKKGFRRELRFKVTLQEPDAAARIESYMMTTDNAAGNLKITYYPEPVQTEIEDGDKQQGLPLQ